MKEYREVAPEVPWAEPRFLLGQGPRRQWYTLVDSYCPRMSCRGGEARFQLLSSQGDDSNISFHADLFKGTLCLPADAGEEALAVARQLLAEQALVLFRRRQLVRAWGLLQGRTKVDLEMGMMCGFGDFTTHREGFTLRFEYEGELWETLDTYCANPDCTCTEISLQFFPNRDSDEIPKVAVVAVLDLETGGLRGVDKKPLPDRDGKIVAAFLDSLGDWHGELSLRRDLLQRIARKRVRWTRPEPVTDITEGRLDAALLADIFLRAGRFPDTPAAPRRRRRAAAVEVRSVPPTRNGPCPCGSGRKYKNCCGN